MKVFVFGVILLRIVKIRNIGTVITTYIILIILVNFVVIILIKSISIVIIGFIIFVIFIFICSFQLHTMSGSLMNKIVSPKLQSDKSTKNKTLRSFSYQGDYEIGTFQTYDRTPNFVET